MVGRRREPVEATVITHRVVKQVRYDATDPGKTYDVREVVVEFPAHDGTIVRLSITEKAYKLVLPEPGSTVPILVNADHTKASFDLADPRIGAKVAQKAQHQKEQAEAEGLDRIFRDAGFEWRDAGCSMCLAMNEDILQPGERCASTSNRNFEGRQGKGGRTFLASPLTAAACAITGVVTDVRTLL